jgi:hypothetical protein
MRAIVDLCVDFEPIQPTAEPATPAEIPPELQIMPRELVRLFTSGWHAALVPATGQSAVDLPSAGASRLELYIQNRHSAAPAASVRTSLSHPSRSWPVLLKSIGGPDLIRER